MESFADRQRFAGENDREWVVSGHLRTNGAPMLAALSFYDGNEPQRPSRERPEGEERSAEAGGCHQGFPLQKLNRGH